MTSRRLRSALGYDSKGNITGDGDYTYTYSSENLLTSLINPTGTMQTRRPTPTIR